MYHERIDASETASLNASRSPIVRFLTRTETERKEIDGEFGALRGDAL